MIIRAAVRTAALTEPGLSLRLPVKVLWLAYARVLYYVQGKPSLSDRRKRDKGRSRLYSGTA